MKFLTKVVFYCLYDEIMNCISNLGDKLVIGTHELDFFPSVGLKLTAMCEFNCPFCCEPNRNQVNSPLNNFIRITSLLYGYGTRRLCLTGGEPLRYANITRLIKHTNSLGFYNLLLTADGEMLKKKYKEILPHISAVRISVHGIGEEHDSVVGRAGAFKAIEDAIHLLRQAKTVYFVTTVVTQLNIQHLLKIAQWCKEKTVSKLFLFGLMKSGRGIEFIEKYGELPVEEVHGALSYIKKTIPKEELDIVYYEYSKNAECILVYGDGKVIIDPCQDSANYQCVIGNILTDPPGEIIRRFSQDRRNYIGYCEHFQMYNKLC